jgi:hypothetical protein
VASHLDGINQVVPRWNPDQLDKGYNYDPKNYDREDYARFKEARQQRDQARQAKAERDLAKATKDAGKVVSDRAREELGRNVREGDVLSIDKPSTCFASVEWEATDNEGNGTCTGTFHRGGAKTYSGPMTLDEFLDWSDDESVGGFYNAQVDAF